MRACGDFASRNGSTTEGAGVPRAAHPPGVYPKNRDSPRKQQPLASLTSNCDPGEHRQGIQGAGCGNFCMSGSEGRGTLKGNSSIRPSPEAPLDLPHCNNRNVKGGNQICPFHRATACRTAANHCRMSGCWGSSGDGSAPKRMPPGPPPSHLNILSRFFGNNGALERSGAWTTFGVHAADELSRYRAL